MASIRRRVRWALSGVLGVGWAAACAQVSSGVGGESHFVCRTPADCESPGDVCFRANPASEKGECVSESVIRDAARHLGSGGAGGAGPTSGGQGGVDGAGASPPTSGPYCGAPQPATYPPPPVGAPPGTRNVEIVAAQYTIDWGDRPKMAVQPTEYRNIGFDLDQQCTTSGDLKRGICRPPSYATGVVDGPGGIDNALGLILQSVRDQIKDFTSENGSKDIQSGKTNLILRVQNWNGEADDDAVTFSAMLAAPFDSFSPQVPAWNGSDAWPIAADSLNGSLDNPKFIDANAYVAGNRVVATLRNAPLRMDVGLSSVQRLKFDLNLSAAFIVCDIIPTAEGRWGYTFEKCTLGGRWAVNDFVNQLGQYPNPLNDAKPLCRRTGGPTYDAFKQEICGQVDILHDTGSPTELCNALTVGNTFTMKPALLGNVYNLDQAVDPCCVPPGCVPGSPEDFANNPKYDCCESIGVADAGRYQACGFTNVPPLPPPPPPPPNDAGIGAPD